MKNYNSQKAFTIIELLVVVAIIGILMAIITANFSSSRAQSRDLKRVSDITQLQVALELYFDRCNRYPTVLEGMPDLGVSEGCPEGITLSTFISRLPTPPTAGDYAYAVDDAVRPADYVLGAKLERNNSALIDDADDTIHGVDCSDGAFNFCAQPR